MINFIFSRILPFLLPFLVAASVAASGCRFAFVNLSRYSLGSGIHSFLRDTHSNMEDRVMGAAGLRIGASNAEGTQGCKNRTGQSPVFSHPKAAKVTAGFKVIRQSAEGRESDPFEPTDDTDLIRGELELWGAVLLQAIEDYRRRGAGYEVAVNGMRLRGSYYDREIRRDERRAEEWFKAKDEDLGSFLWICDLLRLDPKRVWARIREKDFVLAL